LSDGWRYLGLKPAEVYALTHREFTILLNAQRERQYDEFEREAMFAMMYESAHRAKRPKASDLFKRPKNGEKDERKLEAMAKQAEHASEWLSQFNFA
jgi:hypothetical protein